MRLPTVPTGSRPRQAKNVTKPTKPQRVSTKKLTRFTLEGSGWLSYVTKFPTFQNKPDGSPLRGPIRSARAYGRRRLSYPVGLLGCKNSMVVTEDEVSGATQGSYLISLIVTLTDA